MAEIRVMAEGPVAAPAEQLYGYLADYRQHHPCFLPPAFSDFQVESGGVGAGTIIRFVVTAGGRRRAYRMQVAEPQPGRVLTETDTASSMVTTFTVTPTGATSRLRIESVWQGARGIGGFFERLFAPRVLQRLYADELDRINRYAQEQSAA